MTTERLSASVACRPDYFLGYSDGMVEQDMHVGELLKLIDELGLANDTIVQYSTDNGPHYNTWPDGGTSSAARRTRTGKAPTGCPRSCAGRPLPGRKDAQRNLLARGLATHFLAAAGASDVKGKLRAGLKLNGRTYRNHLDTCSTT
jgi:arylsulfatase